MKILIVNTFYFPNIMGGTENSVKLLAEGLKERGHEVAIYCIDNLEKGIKKEYINDILIYRGNGGVFDIKVRLSKNNSFIKKITNKIIELRNYSALNEFEFIIKDFKPDIVHTNNLFGISPLLWTKVKKSNIKIVHTLRDYWILSPTGNLEIEKEKLFFMRAMLKIYRYYFRIQSNKVNAVTAPSNFTLNKFLKNEYFSYSNEKKSINNSIDLNINETYKIINEKKQRKNEIINFMFVGGLFKIKGIENLIKAFMSIENDKIRLHICGDGELRGFVEHASHSDKRIIYKGNLSYDDLKEQYINADVLIVPSIWDEPFGRVVIEGNQFGLPVIASNRGGIPEIIKTMESGEIYSSDNIDELRNKIEKFSERKYINLFYDNIEKNIEKYSINYQIDLFLELYNQALLYDRK